jgi:hypothetical protein
MRANKRASMLGAVLVISMGMLTTAHGQRFPSDETGDTGYSLRTPNMPRVPDSSIENASPRARHFTPESHVPSRSPDLGSAFFPLAPSIGPGSGLLGLGAGPGASRRSPDAERDRHDERNGVHGR